jgi:acyl-CoA hydrolase
MAAGNLQIVDADYSRLPARFGDSIPADVVLLLLPPAEHGYHRLGLADEYLSAAIDGARVIIAEISPHVPSIPGGRSLAAEQIDALVRTDLRPTEMTQPELTDASAE